jgi:hypothetical protein
MCLAVGVSTGCEYWVGWFGTGCQNGVGRFSGFVTHRQAGRVCVLWLRLVQNCWGGQHRLWPTSVS